MLVHITICARDAILHSRPHSGPHSVDLTAEDLESLTDEQREMLSSLYGVGKPVGSKPPTRIPTIDKSVPAIASGLQYLVQERARDREATLKRQELALIRAEHWLGKHQDPKSLLHLDSWSNNWKVKPGPDLEGATGSKADSVKEQIEALLGQARQLRAARESKEHAERKRRQEEADAKEKAERDAFLHERAVWIAKHGSEHLQRLVEEGIAHGETYRNERLAAERPDWEWYEQVCGETVEIRDASEDAMETLITTRGQGIECVLRWIRNAEHVHGCTYGDLCFDDFHEGPVLESTFLGRTIIMRVAEGVES